MRTAADLQAEIEKCEAKLATCTFDRSRKLWTDKVEFLRGELRLQQAYEWAGKPPLQALPARTIDPEVEEVEDYDSGPVLEPEIDLPFKAPPREPEVKHLSQEQWEAMVGFFILAVLLAVIVQTISMCLQ